MSLLSRLAVQAARAYGVLSSKSTNVSADYLVVAGGGSGGKWGPGGGGGAGGYRTSAGTSGGGATAEAKITLSTLNTYTITVGAGGAARSNGSDSVFSTITSTGGGGGGASWRPGRPGLGGSGIVIIRYITTGNSTIPGKNSHEYFLNTYGLEHYSNIKQSSLLKPFWNNTQTQLPSGIYSSNNMSIYANFSRY